MAYNMVIGWDKECSFIFDEWSTDTLGQFMIALFLSLIFSTLSVGYSSIRRNTKEKRGYLINTIVFTGSYVLKIIIMLLMMTMNFYVNLCLVFGMVLGYILFNRKQLQQKEQKQIQ